MNARKLPSGSWRARLFLGEGPDGKKHYKSFTAATKREAERLALTYEQEQSALSQITFDKAFDNYIDKNKNILSPSTLYGYKRMKVYYASLLNMQVNSIDQQCIDAFINDFASNHSSKSVRNAYSLLCCIIRSEIPESHFKSKMPQKAVLQYYIPTDEEVRQLLSYTKKHQQELYYAILLASIGTLRRSEICGLSAEDIDGCVIHVHNVRVISPDGEWVIKSVPKNSSSDRYVEFPKEVIKELRTEGMLCQMCPGSLTSAFGRTIKKLGLPHFRFHDLRHYAATIMHAMGVPEAYVMERGGWKTNVVLNQVYRGTRSDFSKKYAKETNDYFGKNIL